MVSGSGSGGVDRIGGSGAERLVRLARERGRRRPGGWSDPVVRQELMRVLSEERIRGWTNQRVRAGLKAGRPPGPESSIGKVHQGGAQPAHPAPGDRPARRRGHGLGGRRRAASGGSYDEALPYEVRGMLRSRANTIEGGTTEVNKNIVGERVLGLPA